VDGLADDGAPSLLLDYERERRVELDDVIGALVQRAGRLCVPTPHFDSLYPLLRARALAFGGVAGTEEV
jgi:ketopantoate reductase